MLGKQLWFCVPTWIYAVSAAPSDLQSLSALTCSALVQLHISSWPGAALPLFQPQTSQTLVFSLYSELKNWQIGSSTELATHH